MTARIVGVAVYDFADGFGFGKVCFSVYVGTEGVLSPVGLAETRTQHKVLNCSNNSRTTVAEYFYHVFAGVGFGCAVNGTHYFVDFLSMDCFAFGSQ